MMWLDESSSEELIHGRVDTTRRMKVWCGYFTTELLIVILFLCNVGDNLESFLNLLMDLSSSLCFIFLICFFSEFSNPNFWFTSRLYVQE